MLGARFSFSEMSGRADLGIGIPDKTTDAIEHHDGVAAMTDITIRHYDKKDEAAVQKITYRTGFQGEDLTGLGHFDDARLFFLIFIYYYARYEPQHFFVADDTHSSAVVGFICGTPDTAAQQARFQTTMIPRIALRAFSFTIWRYPRTFRTLLRYRKMLENADGDESANAIQSKYPAHLHIDILPEYQNMGIGTMLMQRFEKHMLSQNVKGLHLQTTNHNHKAIPFYHKMGFGIINEKNTDSHPMLDDLVVLTFAKRLSR
jgi:ribosomal protein S18 acetylase RimI-like enzyme